MRKLAARECVPCEAGVPPLKGTALNKLHDQLGDDWQVVDQHHLEKTYTCNNFREALDMTNRVGALAERVGHHPGIYLTWGKMKISIWTHAIDGLAESDFILAAKIEEMLNAT